MAGGNAVGIRLIDVRLIDGSIFVVAGHISGGCQVEYRIGCHNDQRLGRGGNVDYPDLAVRVISLDYAGDGR